MATDQPSTSWPRAVRKGIDDDGAALACTVERDLAEAVSATTALRVSYRSHIPEKVDEIGVNNSQGDLIRTGRPPEAGRPKVADLHHNEFRPRPHGVEELIRMGLPQSPTYDARCQYRTLPRC